MFNYCKGLSLTTGLLKVCIGDVVMPAHIDFLRANSRLVCSLIDDTDPGDNAVIKAPGSLDISAVDYLLSLFYVNVPPKAKIHVAPGEALTAYVQGRYSNGKWSPDAPDVEFDFWQLVDAAQFFDVVPGVWRAIEELVMTLHVEQSVLVAMLARADAERDNMPLLAKKCMEATVRAVLKAGSVSEVVSHHDLRHLSPVTVMMLWEAVTRCQRKAWDPPLWKKRKTIDKAMFDDRCGMIALKCYDRLEWTRDMHVQRRAEAKVNVPPQESDDPITLSAVLGPEDVNEDDDGTHLTEFPRMLVEARQFRGLTGMGTLEIVTFARPEQHAIVLDGVVHSLELEFEDGTTWRTEFAAPSSPNSGRSLSLNLDIPPILIARAHVGVDFHCHYVNVQM